MAMWCDGCCPGNCSGCHGDHEGKPTGCGRSDCEYCSVGVTPQGFRRSACLCGRGGIFKIGALCPVHDDPEVEVIAKALAEWSSGMPWARRTPANRQHWLKLARAGYAAIKDAHAELVKSEHRVTSRAA